MNCTRCQGLMLDEHMIDMEGGYGEMWSVSTRCVNCGHRDDAVIQHHRQLSAKPVMATMSAHEVFNLDWDSAEVESLAA
jgi:C4-type Zn-finger protein